MVTGMVLVTGMVIVMVMVMGMVMVMVMSVVMGMVTGMVMVMVVVMGIRSLTSISCAFRTYTCFLTFVASNQLLCIWHLHMLPNIRSLKSIFVHLALTHVA